MPVIVDGHNLLWAIKHIEQYEPPKNELQLCGFISRYLARISQWGDIVFDGTGPAEKAPFDTFANLSVIFAGIGCDADTIIEKKIKADSAPKRLVIVSSDRRIRRAAQVRRAASVKSEQFWQGLEKVLSRKPGPAEPSGKRHGLSESETDNWMDFFGIGQ